MNFDNTINKSTSIISYALCNMERKAVYPGSFDPITNGHVDIIERGLNIFDRIIVAVLENPKKQPLFSTKERVRMIQDIFLDQKRIEVKAFDGLLVDFVRKNDATIVIRGLRAISDFEYELQMALTNRKLAGDIETVFLMPNAQYSFLSSSVVKEIARLGGDITCFVPTYIEQQLQKKFQTN